MWYMRQKEEFGEDRSQGIRFYDNTQTCDYLPHWHMSYEVIMVIAENLTVIVENERYLLHPGDIMVIPSGVVQRNDTPVRSRFEVHADALLRFVLAAKVIADSVYVDS